MKTIFDKATRDELIVRINSLNEYNTVQWGKMNMYQMLKHCTLWEEMIAGKTMYKRMFLGRLFGKIALKSNIKDDSPMKRNMPTIPGFTIEEKNGDTNLQKKKLVAIIEENIQFSNPGFEHSFFGKMTKEQIGYLDYKHTDHHLRQFGV